VVHWHAVRQSDELPKKTRFMAAQSYPMPILLKSLPFGKQNLQEEALEISGQTLLAAPLFISCPVIAIEKKNAIMHSLQMRR